MSLSVTNNWVRTLRFGDEEDQIPGLHWFKDVCCVFVVSSALAGVWYFFNSLQSSFCYVIREFDRFLHHGWGKLSCTALCSNAKIFIVVLFFLIYQVFIINFLSFSSTALFTLFTWWAKVLHLPSLMRAGGVVLSWANPSQQAWEQMEPVTGTSAGDMRQVMSISELYFPFQLI